MKALIVKEPGKPEVADIKPQSMRPNYIRVKTVAVALNPRIDLSGVVEEVGSACKSQVKKGDRIFAACNCANQKRATDINLFPSPPQHQLEDGAYAEYAMVKDGHLAKIPEGMGFEEAASMGAGVTTVGQALYHNLKLPWPTEPAKTPFPILIYGGSTATGTMAIQYAKLSGLTVLTTASPQNFNLMRSYGADAVFDYHDPDCGAKIRAYTDNALRHVFDCISLEPSFAIDAAALSSDSSQELHCLALLPPDTWPVERQHDVNVRWLLAYTSFGEEFTKYGATWPPVPEHYEMGVRIWELHRKLLEEGKVKPHPVTVKEGGLAGIPEG
ncbi:MAG: hypothetical protein L6R35_001454 [Caloplaca aegaea]|nr:MAG: hypothetical protein L6R35_001454 [Caloplaca aegaea]